jgi:HK97 family phage major capsid protein
MSGNLSILQKADIALADLVADGGILTDAQAKQFIRHMIDASVILPMVRVIGMKSHTQLVEGIHFNQRILRPGVEAQALPLAQRSKPKTTKTTLRSVLVKAQVDLDDEVLEDNLEQGTLKSTVMQLMAERIALDTDELEVKGDTASGDSFLALYDGILKRTTSHIVDAGSTPLTDTILRSLLKAIPSAALRNKLNTKFMTSVDAEIDYRHALSQRGDSLGVSVHGSTQPVNYSGVGIIPVPMFPENLGVGLNLTNVILADPKNWAHGIWRRIKIETQRDVPAGVLQIVATMRMAGDWVLEDHAAKAINVKVA